MFHKLKPFVLNEEKKSIVVSKNQENPLVKEVVAALGFELNEAKEALTTLYSLGKIKAHKVVFVDEEKIFDEEFSLPHLFGLKEDVVVLLDSFNKENISLLFEKMTTAMYRFNKFKSKDDEDVSNVYYAHETDLESDIHEGIVYGEAINHTKQLVNTPYNYLNAYKLADYAKTLGDLEGVEVTVYDKKACEDMNMGAFLGVNKGSKDEPQLIHIRYQGNKNTNDITALIGKGVMYDTGGYSLKTTTGMPNMKCDMAGAATVLGAIEIIARLKYNHNVDVVIAATDNRIGDDAIVPDDILTAANGTTIEIVSTDAEGRLTLADALWFAQKEGATSMIDIATLTGAVVGALGKEFTGIFTNNQEFLTRFQSVTEETKERVWQLPITKNYFKELKSYAADVKNSAGRGLAGASVAAAFLNHFVDENIPWIHLDIAGTSFENKTGATGVMVKSLASYFKK